MTMESLSERLGCVLAAPLSKGWSRDRKYVLEGGDGEKYLLRLSDAALYEKKKQQFALLKKLAVLGLNCSRPVDFGTLDDGSVYTVLTYLEGTDGAETVSGMDDISAYSLGTEAGRALKKLHSLPIPPQEKSWGERYREKQPRKIDALLRCGYTLPQQEKILSYYRSNCAIMEDRPLSFTHGDYHLGNMIVKNGRIGIIDFDKAGAADPYDDLKPFCWNVMVSGYFETGLVNGYFDNDIPKDFFPILKFYTTESLVSHLPWAIGFGQSEIDTAYRVAKLQMCWYADFTLTVPTWYKGMLQ